MTTFLTIFQKISEEELIVFRSESNTSKYSLRDNHNNGDLFSNHGDTSILTRERYKVVSSLRAMKI